MAKSKKTLTETTPPTKAPAKPEIDPAEQKSVDEEDFEHVLRRLVIARDKL